MCEKNYVWNLSPCACEINRYFKSIADDLVIGCNSIIDIIAIFYWHEKAISNSIKIPQNHVAFLFL